MTEEARDPRRPDSVSRGELERRWGLVRTRLLDRGIDALIAVGVDHDLSGTTRWLTDSIVTYRKVVAFYPDTLMTTIDHGAAGLVRPSNGEDPDFPGVGEIISVSEFPSVSYTQEQSTEQLLTTLRRRGCRAVALVNPDNMPSAFRTRLIEGLGSAVAIHDETEFIDRAKAIKSPEEARLIEAAAALQDEVLAATLAHIRPGMAEYEISAFVAYEARRRGGDWGIALAGAGPAGHGPAFMRTSDKGARKLAMGDAVTLLVETGSPAGFYCELGRNAVLGRVAPQQQALHDLLVEAQRYTRSLLKPGARAAEIYAAHNDFMVEHGLQPERRLYAHGQGHDLIERPLIRDDEDMLIEAGMHLAVHPGGVRDGYFGFVCDNVRVEEDGAHLIHRSPQKVFEIG